METILDRDSKGDILPDVGLKWGLRRRRGIRFEIEMGKMGRGGFRGRIAGTAMGGGVMR